MPYHDDILETIGHTPLVRLSSVTDGLPVTLLAKLEMFNPGGSVKDRVGLAMVLDAERKGLLKPGGTIIEATAGNTGVGLALVAARRGYRCIFVMPDKMSSDKVNLLKAYGADVVITPTSVPPDSPESYNGVADRLARDIPGSFRPGQFANPANPEAHYRSTGPEIWKDTEGKIDVFVAGMGTGGTISGIGKFLKEQNPDIRVIGADPEGSILSGDSPKPWLVEGIGEDFIPATFNRQVVDDMVRVSDQEAFTMTRRLAREEGILAGGSSGTAVAAAVKYARRLPPGSTIVVLLPDTGRNYLTKIFSDAWLSEKGLSISGPARQNVGDVLHSKPGPQTKLLGVGPTDSASKALAIMDQYGFSRIPVVENGLNLGGISEITLVKLLAEGSDLSLRRADEVMGKPFPEVTVETDVSEAYRLLLSGHGGLIVRNGDGISGFLTRIDLANYWTTHPIRQRTTS
jgi:cystathionine beta-synthase